MIKRFIKQKSITVTQAINSYGELASAAPTRVVNECCWISSQHVRLMRSRQYKDYLKISDPLLYQIQIELEKRGRTLGTIDLTVENAGSTMLAESVTTCGEILNHYGHLELCIPFPNNEVAQLTFDLVRYSAEFEWLKKRYHLVPFGKLLYSDLVEKMRVAFSGRIPGRHIWHTYKK